MAAVGDSDSGGANDIGAPIPRGSAARDSIRADGSALTAGRGRGSGIGPDGAAASATLATMTAAAIPTMRRITRNRMDSFGRGSALCWLTG